MRKYILRCSVAGNNYRLRAAGNEERAGNGDSREVRQTDQLQESRADSCRSRQKHDHVQILQRAMVLPPGSSVTEETLAEIAVCFITHVISDIIRRLLIALG